MSYTEAYSSYHATSLDAQTSRASPIELVLVLTDGLLGRDDDIGLPHEPADVS